MAEAAAAGPSGPLLPSTKRARVEAAAAAQQQWRQGGGAARLDAALAKCRLLSGQIEMAFRRNKALDRKLDADMDRLAEALAEPL